MKWLCPTKHGNFDILVQKENEGLGMIFFTKGDLFHACGAASPLWEGRVQIVSSLGFAFSFEEFYSRTNVK